MKKFLVFICFMIALYFFADFLYYNMGIYIDLDKDAAIESFTKTEGKKILIKKDDNWEEFEIKGVDMGSGEPGEWATDFSISEDTYYRWFGQIQEMGANTVRIYTFHSSPFYNAFYKYNTEREKAGLEPLYLLHGVWVNDYVQHSRLEAYSEQFIDEFIQDTRNMIDIIHGRKKITVATKASHGSGVYTNDISKWVIGYILGVEWEPDIVAYTNLIHEDMEAYKGEYMYASDDALPFENMLAEVGDKIMSYEADKYKHQRLIAFSNWPTTDPFKYSAHMTFYFNKHSQVNVERILTTDKVISGHFASYHIYPYHPDYLEAYITEANMQSEEKAALDKLNQFLYVEYKLNNINAPMVDAYITDSDFIDYKGRYNTYLAYLTAINRYHTIPVVISEFGVSTGRGMAQIDLNTNRSQGHMSEKEQGNAIVDCYYDIKQAGCAGSCIFTWQDEWFKRTWNTMHAINLLRTPYWSDYQTNEQYFGLLTFDPGKERSVSYTDGDLSEWSNADIISTNGDLKLSMKYDEKFVYLLAEKPGFNPASDTLYIPIDVTPKSGSNYCSNPDVKFENDSDFLIVLQGEDASRLLVQERYDALRSTYAEEIYGFNTYYKDNIPDKSSNVFIDINLALKLTTFNAKLINETGAQVFPTGQLRCGNANPDSPDFDSLADFCIAEGGVEIRLPWQLLNFCDPSRVEVHDDYYDANYGIKPLGIDGIYLGIGNGENRIPMDFKELPGWGNKVTSHERLKSSYYVIKDLWTKKVQSEG